MRRIFFMKIDRLCGTGEFSYCNRLSNGCHSLLFCVLISMRNANACYVKRQHLPKAAMNINLLFGCRPLFSFGMMNKHHNGINERRFWQLPIYIYIAWPTNTKPIMAVIIFWIKPLCHRHRDARTGLHIAHAHNYYRVRFFPSRCLRTIGWSVGNIHRNTIKLTCLDTFSLLNPHFHCRSVFQC